jgi:hypothetical protein
LGFFGDKILKFFDEDPGWRQFGSGIRDGDSSDPRSGMEKSRIRDKHPGSATLLGSFEPFLTVGHLLFVGRSLWSPSELHRKTCTMQIRINSSHVEKNFYSTVVKE